ncbi:hypothetical protein HBH56_018780 [Parastagonospora nodorum]|uniref:Uncharacterized protein n=1 Tax=Phaeosphaeria nodorum (strain SN15 / ATCC MYA-4574 / FGSC 10173) TaxID=321614 RepID=A0A7U2HYR3_PHANO|nr:hypothetical protein HBH56_018780 [Parastagonospora nodorum]QRC95294.1 hypothetical protein JI435_302200 [Parastagonospora nodorum SN15]KAH3937158.1 hypothetical protein HBH54_015710 [Parastagonospora nodorum]KAH3953422.1 hypothetical protein HBH53_027880 [Parastagonospora nodorum]KAH3962744.1 hypothetical protein HBH51_173940 [Parastagonospora nodorum]
MYMINRTRISSLTTSLPSFSLICRDLQEESIMTYLRRTRLVFDKSRPLTRQSIMRPLEHLFKRGFESIRMLTSREASCYGSSTIPEFFYPGNFISGCTGLQDLILGFRPCHLLRFIDEDDLPENPGGESPTPE